MSLRRNVNNFSLIVLSIWSKKSIYGEFYHFIKKKSAAEAHRMLVETYGGHALNNNVFSETTCRDWFGRSKNNDFDVEDKERSGVPKQFEEVELEALFHKDSSQTLAALAELLGIDQAIVSKLLKVLGMIQKQGH